MTNIMFLKRWLIIKLQKNNPKKIKKNYMPKFVIWKKPTTFFMYYFITNLLIYPALLEFHHLTLPIKSTRASS